MSHHVYVGSQAFEGFNMQLLNSKWIKGASWKNMFVS